MNKLDHQILEQYLTMAEAQRQRLWLERLLHPENFKWMKTEGPPAFSDVTKLRIRVLAGLGFGEKHYQKMLKEEKEAKDQIDYLVRSHPFWEHSQRIKIFGQGTYLIGAFVAAGGVIERCPTASSFWKGMGLDVLPDGTVPRKIRGNKEVERKVPCLPHVSMIGDQIRTQIMLTVDCKLHALYDKYRPIYDAKYPDRAKMFNFKAAQRIPQKILYACLWEQWRIARGLPAPWPYAFAILKHDDGHRITIQDLYDT